MSIMLHAGDAATCFIMCEVPQDDMEARAAVQQAPVYVHITLHEAQMEASAAWHYRKAQMKTKAAVHEGQMGTKMEAKDEMEASIHKVWMGTEDAVHQVQMRPGLQCIMFEWKPRQQCLSRSVIGTEGKRSTKLSECEYKMASTQLALGDAQITARTSQTADG